MAFGFAHNKCSLISFSEVHGIGTTRKLDSRVAYRCLLRCVSARLSTSVRFGVMQVYKKAGNLKQSRIAEFFRLGLLFVKMQKALLRTTLLKKQLENIWNFQRMNHG